METEVVRGVLKGGCLGSRCGYETERWVLPPQDGTQNHNHTPLYGLQDSPCQLRDRVAKRLNVEAGGKTRERRGEAAYHAHADASVFGRQFGNASDLFTCTSHCLQHRIGESGGCIVRNGAQSVAQNTWIQTYSKYSTRLHDCFVIQ